MNAKLLNCFPRFNACLLAVVFLLCGGLPALGADPPELPDLQAGSDSGLFDDDNLTNVSIPTIDITAADVGDTIRIYRQGELQGEAILVSGVSHQYTFTEGQLSEGLNVITARGFDGEESGDSDELEITLDISGPKIIDRMPRGAVNVLAITLDSITVTFNEEIEFDPEGESFTTADVTINGPDGEIIPTGIASPGSDEYKISFPSEFIFNINTS